MVAEEMKYKLRTKGKTLTTIAKQANVSVSTVSHVIHRRGKSKNVEQIISTILDTPVDVLFPEEENPLYQKNQSSTFQQSA